MNPDKAAKEYITPHHCGVSAGPQLFHAPQEDLDSGKNITLLWVLLFIIICSSISAVSLYHRNEKLKTEKEYRIHGLRSHITLIYVSLKRLLEKNDFNDPVKSELAWILSQTTRLIDMIPDSRKPEKKDSKQNVSRHDMNSRMGKAKAGTFSDADKHFLTKLDKFVTDNISDDSLNVQMIIEHMCMGRATFYKETKELIGTGIMQYVTDKRMKIAGEMLRNTNLPVTEIAFRVGYKDSRYFSRVFRQVYKATPTAWRKFDSQGRTVPADHFSDSDIKMPGGNSTRHDRKDVRSDGMG